MHAFPWIRSPRAAVVGTLLLVLPMLPPLSGQLGASIYAVMLCQIILPMALCITLTVCGLLPALLGAAAGVYAVYASAGAQAALLCSAYLCAVLSAFVICMQKRVNFWKTVGIVAGAFFASQLLIFIYLQAMLGGDLYKKGAEALIEGIRNAPECDALLYQFHTYGLLALPKELGETFAEITVLKDGVYILKDAVREEFLRAINVRAQAMLLAYVPSALVSQSILSAIFGVSLSIYFGRRASQRRAFKNELRTEPEIPGLDMPELSKWYLPRGVGIKVGILAAGRLLTAFADSETLALAGAMMFVAFSSVYSIQGLAMVNFLQKQRDTKPLRRKITLVVLYLLNQQFQILLLFGILDQALNVRKLRPPRERPAE